MRNASQANPQSGDRAASLENLDGRLQNATQRALNFERRGLRPENLDDDAIVRRAVSSALRACTKSREQVAEEMTAMLGTRVTERMLNTYSGEANQPYRFPAAWDRAFCRATGDDTLLICRVLLAGLFVITPEEKELLELGRSIVAQKEIEGKIALLGKRLGVAL